MVLLEGTNLSEGRGTTRPFEIFGAPWLDADKLVDILDGGNHPGVKFRVLSFEPTFNKYAGQFCHGLQIHVTDPCAVESVNLAVTILKSVREMTPDHFSWRLPPYEYELEKWPIDILWGSDKLRMGIDQGKSVDNILDGVDEELRTFAAEVEPYLLYE
jgi:uncharacterized protein YbbC (DUF1343 family)